MCPYATTTPTSARARGALDECGIAGPLGLQHRHVFRFGPPPSRVADRGRAGPPLGLVRLRDYRDDVESFSEQGLERGDRKLRRSEEDYAH